MKRTALACIAGLAIAGGVFASAASLGGVSSANVGTSATVVASCDTDGVKLDYGTAYDASTGQYHVNEVKVDGIGDACKGQNIEVSLKNADGKVSTTTARTPVEGTSMGLKVEHFSGESVDSAAVLIGS